MKTFDATHSSEYCGGWMRDLMLPVVASARVDTTPGEAIYCCYSLVYDTKPNHQRFHPFLNTGVVVEKYILFFWCEELV